MCVHDPIDKFCPNSPLKIWEAASLHHCLTHSTGLPPCRLGVGNRDNTKRDEALSDNDGDVHQKIPETSPTCNYIFSVS